jgi:uncharacterized membrane protein (DUF106 family)
MSGLMNDQHFVFLILFCAAVITIGSIIVALNRVSRAEFVRWQKELQELSGRVRELELTQQGRFLRELNRLDSEGEAPVLANPRATLRRWTKPSH